MNFTSKIKNHLNNIPGWRTNRKIVVFESDDWGSIRTPSGESLLALKEFGMPVEKCNYMLNDALESPDDLSALFDVLQQFKDAKGNHVKFTANTIVANPDFEKIKAHYYKEYYYESFAETYQRYPAHSNTLAVFLSGIDNNIFKPQLHGREHINISRWMYGLETGDPETLLAFEYGMTGVSANVSKYKRGSYQAAFDGGIKEIKFDHAAILQEASSLFSSIFGFSSKSFIAPNYVWHDGIESKAAKLGIEYFQGGPAQRISRDFGEKLQTIRHYTGQKNKYEQLYIVRNASFEPSLFPGKENIADCMLQIANSFLWGKPAVVSTHRVNYIGFLNPQNAENSLRQLSELMRLIIKKWPSVEFMFTDELGDLIKGHE